MDPLLGQIMMFGGNFAPRGWALCDGQLLSIAQNSALFSILGTTYGGDGRTSFGLPDLRSRVPIHPGTGSGLSTYRLGQRGGVENVTLNTTQIPSHNHIALTPYTAADGDESSLSPASSFANAVVPNGRDNAEVNVYNNTTKDGDLNNITITNTGGSLSHTNVQPFLSINYIIATVGVFPSRN